MSASRSTDERTLTSTPAPSTRHITTHGLDYPESFVDALPHVSALDRKIPLLPPRKFSELHLSHTTSHPPDNILFPFLHGLEGDNDSQNHFFASVPTASTSLSTPSATLSTVDPPKDASKKHSGGMMQYPNGKALRPPLYRGLVWVVCDEDVDPQHLPLRFAVGARTRSEEEDDEAYSSSDDDYLSSSDDEFARDEDDSMGVDTDAMDLATEMHMDVDVDPPSHPMEHVSPTLASAEAHMHPVAHRPIPISTSPSQWDHDRRPSNASDGSDASTPSSYSGSLASDSGATSATSATSPALSTPPSPICAPEDMNLDSFVYPSPTGASKTRVGPPPVLTSSFLPSALIRRTNSVRFGAIDEVEMFDELSSGASGNEDWVFRPAIVPDGISLRNFGIQVPVFATLSDIVVYSPKGASPAALRLAARFRSAVDKVYKERLARLEESGQSTEEAKRNLLNYNVFVLDADARTVHSELPHLVARREDSTRGAHTEGHDARIATPKSLKSHQPEMSAGPHHRANTVDFAQREKEEMRDLTRASEIISVFPSDWQPSSPLASTSSSSRPSTSCASPSTQRASRRASRGLDDRPASAPIIDSQRGPQTLSQAQSYASGSTPKSFFDPRVGQVYLGNASDVPLPPKRHRTRRSQELRARNADEERLEEDDLFDCATNDPAKSAGFDICVECHDYVPFPSATHLRAAEEHIRALERAWEGRCRREAKQSGDKHSGTRPRPPPHASAVLHLPFPSASQASPAALNALMPFVRFLERMVSPGPVAASAAPPIPHEHGQGHGRAASSPGSCGGNVAVGAAKQSRTTLSRPLKVLLYSADGYTESSVPALCLLMAIRHLSLPEAYLELQVAKRRSFFVYQNELGLLRKVEARLGVCGTGAVARRTYASPTPAMPSHTPSSSYSGPSPLSSGCPPSPFVVPSQATSQAKPGMVHTGSSVTVPLIPTSLAPVIRRPRASTLPAFVPDHQSWFNDPRFDGSFPSRVLPFLYLGNLNHATNAYMLHALGITHVVSVGECALVPPPSQDASAPHASCGSSSGVCGSRPSPSAQYVPGKGPGGQGSLWIEEREGRIKVLDIQGVCDDGIDTLEPQLEPVCNWIEKARLEGGQVLVHCRVGVSRSATVTIAYVMKHLGLPLVDAYLIVRSRRLSVLIQPNMRLLYNLLGWEVKLARERAIAASPATPGANAKREPDPDVLRNELAKALNWPYLAQQVHMLNEKYLR
ncbi:hypothetical protein CONPUDRAFT_135868 [Coniophora puteana RWD-64-598 SS2]|uniref:Uncharacterized protein n=1 Tax=Coniophora puteana (strain RWD-64-598) TaxID=741705 RepID=A0A5M3MZJ6_CONPW|nr:uncharacterized protein CONPUDRAFT_135868 [Coniophora puteana RWD-64-598 SS2]EIW84417.1 hypothetical protein CONPUDRAFT_135868 [Coniophora puteana RWD-64-598 SS2]